MEEIPIPYRYELKPIRRASLSEETHGLLAEAGSESGNP